jgi:hypothetical protein
MLWRGKLAGPATRELFRGHFITPDNPKDIKGVQTFWLCMGIALCSRLLFLLFLVIGRNIPHIQGIPGEDNHLTLYNIDNLRVAFASATAYGDFDWYSRIALNGYTRAPFSVGVQQNWAFFPLQSLLILAVHGAAARFMVGFATFAIGMAFFVAYALKYTRRDEVLLSCAFICFSPYSGSLSQFRPDSVLFFSLCGMLYFASRRWIVPCIVLLVLAGLAKPNGFVGVILVAAYFGEDAQDLASFCRKNWLRFSLIGLAGMTGLIFMSAMSLVCTGNPFAWAKIQAAWGNWFFVRPVIQFAKLILDPQIVGRSGWDFELFNWFVFAACVLSIYALAKRRVFFLAIFGALYLLTTFLGFGNWTLMKHLAASPAMPIGLGVTSKGVPPPLILAVLLVFAALFGVVAVAMGAGVGAALI